MAKLQVSVPSIGKAFVKKMQTKCKSWAFPSLVGVARKLRALVPPTRALNDESHRSRRESFGSDYLTFSAPEPYHACVCWCRLAPCQRKHTTKERCAALRGTPTKDEKSNEELVLRAMWNGANLKVACNQLKEKSSFTFTK